MRMNKKRWYAFGATVVVLSAGVAYFVVRHLNAPILEEEVVERPINVDN